MSGLRYLISLTIMLPLTLWTCHNASERQITDIINTVNLEAGKPDTLEIADLFFAKVYNLKFHNHPEISIKYDSLENKVVLKPFPNHEGLSLISFSYNGITYQIPVKTEILQKYTFRYKPKERADQVTLFGSFNSWNRENLKLLDPDGDGQYKITLSFEPGRYEYKFFVDGKEILDPDNPEKASNPFGSFNSILTIFPRKTKKPTLHFLRMNNLDNKITLVFAFEFTDKIPGITPKDVIALIDNRLISSENINISNNLLHIDIKKAGLQGKQVVRIAITKNGASSRLYSFFLCDDKPCGLPDEQFLWNDAIIYSIMIDRFFDGDPANTQVVHNPDVNPKANFYGGDLQGILQKLTEDYFDSLGINVLWLSPVAQNTFGAFREYPPPHRYFTGYHGYWPIANKIVDVRFGDIKIFKKLVRIAHEKNMKVILDFVSNHVHKDHPYFREHPDWFCPLYLPDGRQNLRRWDEYRLTTWFDTFLPSFDYVGSSEALEAMTDLGVWWIKETGIDGFRQDAVKHVPNKFWRTLTRKIKNLTDEKRNTKIFQIGETFGSYKLISSYVNSGQLDSQFNFNLYDVALQVFLNPNASFKMLDYEMSKTFDVYGMNHLMGNLMDSHDKVRYMAYADGDLTLSSSNATELGWDNPPQVDYPLSYRKTRLYLAYLLTIPGIPVLYYGDEIGMTGAADPDNRRPMRFKPNINADEKEMLNEVSKLIRVRRQFSQLRYGDFLTLLTTDHIYAYLRSDLNGHVLIILNKGVGKNDLKISIPNAYEFHFARDVFSQDKIKIQNHILPIAINSTSWKIFQLY